ncbi:heat-shock protein, partial [Trifolium medium]|nr:heat-shock protein [Trifolium medium]
MRLRICGTQLQALTQEAATFVKQAVNLATRRSHSQVTPLHLATVMLSNSTTLLHKACLQCHSHPLHYKALEI